MKSGANSVPQTWHLDGLETLHANELGLIKVEIHPSGAGVPRTLWIEPAKLRITTELFLLHNLSSYVSPRGGFRSFALQGDNFRILQTVANLHRRARPVFITDGRKHISEAIYLSFPDYFTPELVRRELQSIRRVPIASVSELKRFPAPTDSTGWSFQEWSLHSIKR
jgi:hypothetical protein